MNHDHPHQTSTPVSGKPSWRLVLLIVMVLAIAGLAAANLMHSPPQEDVKASSPDDHSTKPSRPVEVERVAQTYKIGAEYRSNVVFGLDGRGTNRDWGITVNTNFHYLGQVQTLRQIEANDGTTLVALQTMEKARNLHVATQVDNISYRDLGTGGELMLKAIDLIGVAGAGMPLGWTELSREQAQTLMNLQFSKDILGKLASDAALKSVVYVDELEGKTVRLTYVNGQGVQKVEPINCTLSENEMNFLMATAMISDTYVLVDPDCQVGAEWTIQGRDVLPVVDPSMHATMDGKLHVRRAKDEQGPRGKTAVIELDKQNSHLVMKGYDKSHAYLGDWYPSGQMRFSFQDKIVTQSNLSGDFSIQRESTDHYVFKSEFKTEPRYSVDYTCALLP